MKKALIYSIIILVFFIAGIIVANFVIMPLIVNMGREVVVAITQGRLDFGTWERIFYGEFDGRRKKRVLVKIIGE